MKRSIFEQIVLYEYRYILGYLALISSSLFVLFWRLGSLLPGISLLEAKSGIISSNWRLLIDNPVDAPYHLIQKLSILIFGPGAMGLRITSAILAVFGLLLFYKILAANFSRRVAISGALIFATSSWLLSFARTGIPAMMTIFLALLLVYAAMKVYETRKLRWLLTLATAAGLGIYSPYFIYLLLIGLVISWSTIGGLRGQLHKNYAGVTLIWFVILILPLVYAVSRSPDIGMVLLGIPTTWPSLHQFINQIGTTISFLFWRSSLSWSLHLGTLPMLDIFSAAMFTLGLYHLDQNVSRALSQYTLVAMSIMLLIISINPTPLSFAILLPFVYMLVASGIVMLFSQWYEIFPRNPIARMTIIVPLLLVISTTVWYHYQRYFVAWAHTPEVVEQFSPLSSSLNSYTSSHPNSNGLIMTSPDEKPFAELVSLNYPSYKFTTTPEATVGQSLVLLSQEAYDSMDNDTRKTLPPQKQVIITPYDFQPISLRVFSNQ